MHWLGHWLGTDNAAGPVYLFLSGFAGDLGLLAATAAFTFHGFVSYRHKNCHVHRCVRVGHLAVEGTAWVVCRRHSPTKAPTHAEVVAAHHAAKPTRPPKRLARTQETGTTGNARPGGT
jgi:hypothetical protein